MFLLARSRQASAAPRAPSARATNYVAHSSSAAAAPAFARLGATVTARRQIASTPAHLGNDSFVPRHVGPTAADERDMLAAIGVANMVQLTKKLLPPSVAAVDSISQLDGLPAAHSESEVVAMLRAIGAQNKIYKNYLGQGFYGTLTPLVILRNILENPAWYTAYTPYQPEISQGRLEMLLTFQTLIADLTGLPYSNASLLDESSAAVEAFTLASSLAPKAQAGVWLVDSRVHPQTIAVVRGRAEALNAKLIVGDAGTHDYAATPVAAALVQYPDTLGRLDAAALTAVADRAHASKALLIAATDLLACAVAKPPGELGADLCVGSAQRFGVPMGYGGPHAGFMSVRDPALLRKLPGRMVGISKDAEGMPAYRLALQTREQHIRRDKATSNICTAQALLANMAAAYAVYHGPAGVRSIALRVHFKAVQFANAMLKYGHKLDSKLFFDTVTVHLADREAVFKRAAEQHINLRRVGKDALSVAFDETTTDSDVVQLAHLFHGASHVAHAGPELDSPLLNTAHAAHATIARQSAILKAPVFNSYHSETEMMRYLHKLVSRDYSLVHGMIPLGSCTMKLNAVAELSYISDPNWNALHPFAPSSQARGYERIVADLTEDLIKIIGFDAVSLQPNAGSAGEYAGLMTIRRYLQAKGQGHRNVALIPSSAHGTNPASAVCAGLKVVVVECDKEGTINKADLTAKIEKHASHLACIMVTYPSTFGVFDADFMELCDRVHAAGGQVYLDGANMNAQLGICAPGKLGPDVCHLNLHKTFCIPHGGGGPGVGAVCANKHLKHYLPSHPFVHDPTLQEDDAFWPAPVAAGPIGSALILPITWAYIRLMGAAGLRKSGTTAVLAANYMAKRLEKHYEVAFRGDTGMVAHEFILDLREWKKIGIEPAHIAKRLMDYGFHAPTMSWPVHSAMMIEPTESESKAECDRLVSALLDIHADLVAIRDGKQDATNNVILRAPHTYRVVCSDSWDRPYSRERAAFPMPASRHDKFWPSVSRIDDVYGDKNLVCVCGDPKDYE